MAKGDFTIAFDGLAKLESRMLGMGRDAKPVLMKALRGAAKVIQTTARANIRKGKDRPGHKGGMLAKSIRVYSSARKSAVYVGTSGGESLFTGKTFYGGFVEFGHKLGSRKLGNDRRDVPAHPFLSKAVAQKRRQLQDVIESQFNWAALKRGHG